MRASSLLLLWVVLAGGCFKPNLGDGAVACGEGGLCPTGYVCDMQSQRCVRMLSGGEDLSVAGSGDMAGGGDMAGACAIDGTRVCLDGTHSAVCSGGAPVADRTCPPGSSCTNGRCAPASMASSCGSTKACGGGAVCDQYDVNGVVVGYCTKPISGATGVAGTTCTTAGYDDSCKTGICASDAATGTSRACLYPCKGPGDCGGGLVCTAVVGLPSTIEGAPTGGLKFCTH